LTELDPDAVGVQRRGSDTERVVHGFGLEELDARPHRDRPLRLSRRLRRVPRALRHARRGRPLAGDYSPVCVDDHRRISDQGLGAPLGTLFAMISTLSILTTFTFSAKRAN